MGRRRFSACLLIGIFLLTCLPSTPLAAPVPVRTTVQPKALSGSATALYAEAKTFHSTLEQDKQLGDKREHWLTGVRRFRRVQLMHGTEELTVNSLYMQGRLYRQMYERFRVPLDLDNAIDSFYDVAALYPKSSLADDALYAAAEASLLHPVKKQQAQELLQKIIRSYPGGDHAQAASNLLRQLSQPTAPQPAAARRKAASAPQAQPSSTTAMRQTAVPAKTAPSPPPAPTTAQTTHSATGLAWVQPVKYWSSDDYTRIVIPVTAAVPFSSTLLEKKDNMPRRLFVDFSRSTLPTVSQEALHIDDGLLKQVRFGQYTPDTVRVVLDIESLSDYKVFSLPDPFRVIIDVHGVKTAERSKNIPLAKIPPAPEHRETDTKRSPVQEMTDSEATEPEGDVAVLMDQKKTSVAASVRQGRGSRQGPLSLAQQLGLGVRRIVIDPGHGGKDPGAMAFGLKEKDVVLRLSKILAKKLQEQHGYEVSLTRTRDVFLPLEERTAIANTQKADLFLSMHVNAHPDKQVGGVETYFLNLATDADAMRVAALENATSTHSMGEMQDILQGLLKNAKIDESSRLARFIHRNLARGLARKYKSKNRGVKQAPFYVLIGAEMPAVLVEIAFITNPAEAKLLRSDSYLDRVATEIASGITAYVEHHHSAALQQY